MLSKCTGLFWLYALLLLTTMIWPTLAATLVQPPDPQHSIGGSPQSDLNDLTQRGIIDGTQSLPEEHIQCDPGHIQTDTSMASDSASLLPRSSVATASDDISTFTLPKPFDTNLSNNFTTTSCPSFFNTFLSNSTITSCHAISLLLQDSTSFFHTLSSRPATSRTLDAACSAAYDTCSTIFSNLAHDLLQPSACKQDYDLGNPLVTDAYADFMAYDPIYKATCLTSPKNGDYCFLDTVFSNSSSAADYAVYFMPLGAALPTAKDISCDKCLQATMRVFARYAQHDGQPLAGSYLSSARAIGEQCGRGIATVNITVGKSVSSGGSRGVEVGLGWGMSLRLVIGLVWLFLGI